MFLLLLPVLLLLLIVEAGAQPSSVLVPFWTDDAGYCKPLPGQDPGVHRPDGLVPITIKLGDSLNFKFSTHHDVWLHSTQESFDKCRSHNSDTATMIAGTGDGGGCTEDEDLSCIAAAAGFVFTPTTAGSYWFTCSVHDHCVNGQKLAVTVTEESGRDERGGKSSSGTAAGAALFLLGAFVGVAGNMLFVRYYRGRRGPLSEDTSDDDGQSMSMEQISSI